MLRDNSQLKLSLSPYQGIYEVMGSVRIRILCMKFSTVMVQGAFPCHKTNRPLQ